MRGVIAHFPNDPAGSRLRSKPTRPPTASSRDPPRPVPTMRTDRILGGGANATRGLDRRTSRLACAWRRRSSDECRLCTHTPHGASKTCRAKPSRLAVARSALRRGISSRVSDLSLSHRAWLKRHALVASRCAFWLDAAALRPGRAARYSMHGPRPVREGRLHGFDTDSCCCRSAATREAASHHRESTATAASREPTAPPVADHGRGNPTSPATRGMDGSLRATDLGLEDYTQCGPDGSGSSVDASRPKCG